LPAKGAKVVDFKRFRLKFLAEETDDFKDNQLVTFQPSEVERLQKSQKIRKRNDFTAAGAEQRREESTPQNKPLRSSAPLYVINSK